jgi:hypothetical protein
MCYPAVWQAMCASKETLTKHAEKHRHGMGFNKAGSNSACIYLIHIVTPVY